jgi:phi13 family phage major tail protein
MSSDVIEFRGVDSLVYAPVTADDNESGSGHGYETGAVKVLAPVAQIGKEIEQASATKYYDNKAAIVVSSVGADTITITLAALGLATLADVTGQYLDPTTGALAEGEAKPKYFALGYRFLLTDGTYRYVWRYKGLFNIPKDGAKTQDNSADSSNQELTYTGVNTSHKFAKGGCVKALVVDERDGKADLSTFFDEVTTPDTLLPVVG